MYGLINNEKNATHQQHRNVSHNYEQHRMGSPAWFDECVRKGRVQPFAVIATISPELAEHVLNKNDDNRPTVSNNVIKIANDIESGLWALNGETIIVSEEGLLNDGQHRMQAVILTGMSIETVLFFGAPRKSRFTVDMGAARTCGHLLAMDGITDSNQKAAAGKLLLIWSRGAYTNADHIAGTKQEVRAFFEENRINIEKAYEAVANRPFSKAAGQTMMMAGHVILHQVNPAACGVFFEKLIDGADLQKGSAILQARNHFATISEKRLNSWEKLELLLRYWNAWRRGRVLNRNISVAREWPKIEG